MSSWVCKIIFLKSTLLTNTCPAMKRSEISTTKPHDSHIRSFVNKVTLNLTWVCKNGVISAMSTRSRSCCEEKKEQGCRQQKSCRSEGRESTGVEQTVYWSLEKAEQPERASEVRAPQEGEGSDRLRRRPRPRPSFVVCSCSLSSYSVVVLFSALDADGRTVSLTLSSL